MTPPTVHHHTVGAFRLESGVVLHDVVQAYTLTGHLNARRDNVILLFHSLTGGPDPAVWWPRLVGPGSVLDTEQYAVLCPNLLGSCQGTSPVPADALVTPRDMVRLIGLLVEALGVRRVRLAAGGSLGGMVTLEWVATQPCATRAAVVFAAPAAHGAQAIAHNHVQRRAVQLAGADGLALARMAALLTYRTAAELETRFGRVAECGRFNVQSYLDHHGRKLVHRFDATSYVTLLDAMDAHDVGRGRGGVAAALAGFDGYLLGVGIPGDLLYSADEVHAWTRAVPCNYAEIHSIHGHDAFLLEEAQAAALLQGALRRAQQPELRLVNA